MLWKMFIVLIFFAVLMALFETVHNIYLMNALVSLYFMLAYTILCDY